MTGDECGQEPGATLADISPLLSFMPNVQMQRIGVNAVCRQITIPSKH